MTLYIYRNVITLDQDCMDDYIFEQEARYIKNVDTVDSRVATIWEQGDVEMIEDVTIEKLMEYINEGCWRLLEHQHMYK